ncbi:MAG: hypothetical protein ABJA37_06100 [Ferruginibacter sp.]
MKKFILPAVIFCTPIFFGCTDTGSGDPKIVLSQFVDALAKKDIATARKLATAESKSMLDLMEMGMKGGETKDLEKYDKNNMEFGEAKINGDKATVPVKEKTSGETINYSLKKEGGQWKVAFDKASLMGTITDKMQEKGINPMDSLKKGMDELKKINIDSLKQGMQKGVDALDSLSKELKKIQ